MQEGAHCPPCWMKICALFIPKEMKLEHSALLKNLTDEQLDQAMEMVKEMLEAHAGDDKVIEETAEAVALPAPAEPEPPKRKPNRLMIEVDTAVGPKERTPRQRKVPSPGP
jgi:hypothetical protein